MRKRILLPRRVTGFTLLELLAVILIMAIGLSLLTFGVNRGLAAAKDQQAGRDITLALRAARATAIATQQPTFVRFNLQNNTFQAPGHAVEELPGGLHVRITTAADLVSRDAAIAFYPTGNSSGGNVYLERRGQAWRVDVSWLTGVATWHKLVAP